MKFLDRVYSIKFIENGKFCWKVSVRDKVLEDYKASDRISLILSVIVLIHLINFQ